LHLLRTLQVLRRDLMHALQKKRPGLASDVGTVIFHQDNAPSHKSAETQLEIDLIGFQRLAHPPYSPDLAPLDFAYFPALKGFLRGRRFDDRESLKYAIQAFNRGLPADWCPNVFQSWVRRHRKCVEHDGEYFEKL